MKSQNRPKLPKSYFLSEISIRVVDVMFVDFKVSILDSF